MEDRYIAAIDLGSSKIALSVAYIEGADMRIVYYEEQPSAGIRNSGIFNETKAAAVVKKLVKHAEEELGIKIIQAVTSLSRNGIVTENSNESLDSISTEDTVKAEDILELKNRAKNRYECSDTKLTVYEAIAQSFSNGDDINLSEEDVIGTSGAEITGDFKVFLGSRKSFNCITNMANQVGICSAREYFIPAIIGKAVLSEDEIENGVAVVDLGGGCTSVSIFIGGILRFFSSIPFGGKEVTSDIRTESNINDRLAENIKLGYGVCIPEKLLNLTDKQLLIKSDSAEPDKRISVKYLSEIITAREEEILEAIIYEIDRSGFSRQIPSGIVITGGGANMTNLEMLITRMSGYRVRKGYPQNAQGISDCNGILETSAAASVAMLFAAKEDSVCACATIDTSAESTETTGKADTTGNGTTLSGTDNGNAAVNSGDTAGGNSSDTGKGGSAAPDIEDSKSDNYGDDMRHSAGQTKESDKKASGESRQGTSTNLFQNDPDYENTVESKKGKKAKDSTKPDKQQKHIKTPAFLGKIFDTVINFSNEIADEVGKDEL